LNRKQLDFLMEDLRRRYLPYRQHLTDTALGKITAETEDPFKVLISTILSQRTRDEMTDKASHQLFAKFPDAESIAAARLPEIMRLIKPVGFYRQKAASVRDVSRIILREYGGKVPPVFDELLKLPQVGPKTANCVLVYGFGIPRIPVDTHVHRITNRLGLVKTKTPDETEAALMKVVAKEYWIDLNGLLVRFGQSICRPIGPRCSECNFGRFCLYYKTVMQ
jgi:endonuclease-3